MECVSTGPRALSVMELRVTWAGQLRRLGTALFLLPVALPCTPFFAQQIPSGVQATTVEAAGPAAVAYDSSGNLYLALQKANLVRRVDSTGLITTVAGTGEQGFSGDGGSATSAILDSPSGIAIDPTGTIYIADTHNNRVRRVSNGTITTIAGTGAAGFAGDGGSATAAQLNAPVGLSIDSNGALYIADSGNQRIRRISNGTITTVAGNGEQGFAGDGGAATSAALDTPFGIAVDPTVPGRFYIADRHNHRVRAVAADGTISTLAGTGLPSFSGDGAAAAAAALSGPRGVTVAAAGTVYVADSDNQRVRSIAGGTIATAAGTGEQGFSGDIGASTSSVLDTPVSATINSIGTLAFADLHNQRARAIASTQINTVAGIAPPLTEGLFLSAPLTGTYGTDPGQLTAVFSNNGNSASGTATLYQDGAVFARQAFSSGGTNSPNQGNTVSFSLAGVAGGLHSFAVAYAGDTVNAPAASGVYLINIAAATQTVGFPALQSPVSFPPGLTVNLAATASSGLPITYTVAGPATVSGSTLIYTGAGTVVVTATQSGNANYSAASAQQTVTVVSSLITVSGINPATAPLGTSNLPLTVTGSGFTRTSIVQLNGTALPTTFVSNTQLSAMLPSLLSPGALNVSVFDPASQQGSSNAPFTVTAPTASAQLSLPSTSKSAQQPSLNFQLQTAYPVAINGVLTLSFTPDGSLTADPTVQFSTGGRTLNFTIPANTTTVPTVAFQTGTVAGTITVTLSLTAGGVDVTPASARVATVTVGRQAPVATVSFSQSGPTLTVTVRGYSNTRDVTQANFTFTPAPGSDLATKTISLPVTPIFSSYYADSASASQGSVFTYTQAFNLSDGGAIVQSVGLDLTNSTGTASATPIP